MENKIIVLDTDTWFFGYDNTHAGGQTGQITHCRYMGIEFYVRENINGLDSFLISSGERQGDKAGDKKVRACRQVLELFCPNEHFKMIATAVRAADDLKRQVRENKKFGKQFLKKYFKK